MPSTESDSEWYRKTRNWTLHIGSQTLNFSTQQLSQVSTEYGLSIDPSYTLARVGFNDSAFNTANSPFANGARLNLKITVPAPSSVPGAPRSLAAVGGNNGRVNLSWQPPSSGGGVIQKYRYRYSAGSAVSSSASWIDVPDSSDPGRDGGDEYRTTVRGLANATQYAFELQAVNGAGSGSKTGPVTATPTLPVVRRVGCAPIGTISY